MDDLKKLQLYGIKPLDITLSGFAEACYNENSVDELVNALSRGFDKRDGEVWDINQDEWMEAILNALCAKRFHLEQETKC